MKQIFFLLTFQFAFFYIGYCQTDSVDFNLALSGGNIVVGKGNMTGVWTSVEVSKNIYSKKKMFLNRIALGGELQFENGTDDATIYNPTPQQFISDRFYHESNTGLTAKLSFYPFTKFLSGFYIAAGPVLVYSIRTREKRAELIQYGPNLSIRMTEIESNNQLLFGYRLNSGYDIFFSKRWFIGVRADFLKYGDRDLNSLLGAKIGIRFK
jgi:hypothetical protein